MRRASAHAEALLVCHVGKLLERYGRTARAS